MNLLGIASGLGKHRPIGVTLLSAAWLLAGAANLYGGMVGTRGEITAISLQLPYFGPNGTEFVNSSWVNFMRPYDLAGEVLAAGVGVLQFVTASGLLWGRPWSYRGALAVVVLTAVGWVLNAAIRFSAPPEFHLVIPELFESLVGVFLWIGIYLLYLRKPHVKEYLGVSQPEEPRVSDRGRTQVGADQ